MPFAEGVHGALNAFAKAAQAEPKPHAACAAEPWSPCEQVAPASEVEQSVPYRQPVELVAIPSSLGDPIEGQAVLRLGCTALANLSVTLGIDLRYEQQWRLLDLRRGALSTVLAIGPGEMLRLMMSSTQRKHFTKQTLDEVEEATSSESEFVDRDVLNVARASTTTRNWTVSGNAALTLPPKKVGVNASLSSTVTDSATQSAESVTESTTKAAESLTLLHKVEVTEVAEFETTSQRTRTVENPYRDRSLQMRVFGLQKFFCVHFVATSLQPIVAVEIDLVYDRAFVLRNGDFLVKKLMDRYLQTELIRALEHVEQPFEPQVTERAANMARRALRYLFDEMTIFNVPAVFQGPFVAPVDGNLIAESFDASHANSGLLDARDSQVAIVFTTLNSFHHLYLADSPLGDRDAIELASSLARTVGPLWDPAAETPEISDVLGINQPTEIFRRLGGFLALVVGTLDPLLADVAEESETRRARKRAEFVIDRVIDHLECFSQHYSAQFLQYLRDATAGTMLSAFVEQVLTEAVDLPAADQELLVDLFSPQEAFLDGRTIVVPGRLTFDDSGSDALVELLDGQSSDKMFSRNNVLQTFDVAVPTDGMDIEPVAGTCVLDEVPAAVAPAGIDVRIVPGEEPSA